MDRLSPRRLLAILALPLLALGLLIPSQHLFRCTAEGVARIACCCSSAVHGESAGPEARIGDRCCCDSETAGPTTTASVVAPRGLHDPSTLLASVVMPVTFTSPRPARSPQFDAVPHARPPNASLVLLKGALLI